MRGIAVIVLALLLEAAVLLQLALPGLPEGGPAAVEMARAAGPAAPAGHLGVPCRDGKKC